MEWRMAVTGAYVNLGLIAEKALANKPQLCRFIVRLRIFILSAGRRGR